MLQCVDGARAAREAAPAPCFDGGSVRCRAGHQSCEVGSGGAAASETYDCVDAPDPCGGAVSCACLDGAGGPATFGSCRAGPDGQVRVTIAYP